MLYFPQKCVEIQFWKIEMKIEKKHNNAHKVLTFWHFEYV